MSEQDFLALPATTDYAARHRAAYAALRSELDRGDLSTDASRRDRANVIAVLNRVWQLSPAISEELATAFGATLEEDLTTGATFAGRHLHRLDEIPAGWADDGTAITVADLVGKPAPGESVSSGKRVGPFAYSSLAIPQVDTEVRAYLRRAQLSLNQDIPMYMSLIQDDAFDDANGMYGKPADGKLTANAYSHAVLVFDETVETIDFGVLLAGKPETRPQALASSLRDDAEVHVLRAVNSYWGTYDPGAKIPFVDGKIGINDYAMDYLTMPIPGASRRVLNYLTVANDPAMVLAKKRP